MPTPERHPDWCAADNCARTGIHESAPAIAGDKAELVGVAATRIRLGQGLDAIRVAFTDEGTTATYVLPLAQARALTRTIDRLLTS